MMLLAVSGRGYRALSAGGAIAITLIANLQALQVAITTHIPLIRRLQPTTLHGEAFDLAALTTLLIVGIAVAPFYKPQPRRILNVVYHTHRRVIIASLALATIGMLLVFLPAWFVATRRRPDGNGDRILIIGDDPAEIKRVYNVLNTDPVGYAGPALPQVDGGISIAEGRTSDEMIGDQGRLGGLSRLAEVITTHEIDTVVFAFERTDRGGFFGALSTCHDHGVGAVIRRDRTDSVLITGQPGKELVHIDVEPWDWQDRVIKRTFYLAFSITALLALSPVSLGIAAAVKLGDQGSILYEQERTAEPGETFFIYKFQSMKPRSETVAPPKKQLR